jgi:predicted ATPase/class 3 adenylate cyclase
MKRSQTPGDKLTLRLMTLTFLLTDVEGSTRLWESHRQAMAGALATHDRLISTVVVDHGGRLVKAKGEGDSTFSVFTSTAPAVAAALELQRALAAEPWPLPAPLMVRVAVHAGDVQEREADFYGPVVNRCARLRAIGHGGQVLLSAAVAELVRNDLPEGAYLRDLGVHRLKDLAAPERVVQLCHPDLRAEFPRLNSLEARPNNLPMQLTSFIGRESELAELRQLLVGHRLVTLTGIGGCGKTRLALQAAADVLDAYPDGVWLVELAPLSEPSLVDQQLATVLGIREAAAGGPGVRSLTDRLVDHLASRRTLVLLDNCEHLVEDCARLAARLVGACPKLTVLATSREPLGVAGEVTFGVPPLVVDSPDPAEIGGIEAVQLFVDRARLADPAFGLTSENAPAVASICRRLDGIPLAIELAAARTRSLTSQQLDARLGDRFRLLAGGSRTSLPRHRTLRAAIEWSHRLLSGPEQILFRRLAVFAGGCTLEAAEEVCAEDDDLDVLLLIPTLVDKSLLVHEAAQGRYRMLETIRQFAWDKLVEADEVEELRGRHRDWCLALAEAAEFATPAATAWLARLAAEQDNFRAALEWDGPTGDDGARRLRLGGALREFWWAQAQSGEGRHWLERALRAAPDAPAAARATALLGAGLLAGEQGDPASASTFLRQGQALYEQLGDRRGLAEALVGLGETAVVQGRYEQARPLLERAVREAQAAGSQHLAALALNFIGNGLYLQGRWTAARPMYEQAREGFQSVGNPHGVAVVIVQIGLCALEGGDQHEARALVREGLQLARRLDFRWGELYGLDGAALLAARTGNWEVAATLLGATDGPREANPAPQLGVREAGIAGVTAALDSDSLSGLWDKAKAMPLDQAIDYALQHL